MRVNPGGLSGSGPILVLLIYQVNHNELDLYSKYVRYSFESFVKTEIFPCIAKFMSLDLNRLSNQMPVGSSQSPLQGV